MMGGRLSRMSSREQVGLVLSVAGVILVSVDWLVVRPVLRESRRLAMEIASAETNLRQCRDVQSVKAGVEKEYRTVSRFMRPSTSRAEEIANMKGEIDEMTRRSGVVVAAMEHEEPRLSPVVEEYFVRIGKFDADRRSLLAFLNELQNSASMLRVAQMSLSPGTVPDQVKGSMLVTKVMLPGGDSSARANDDSSAVPMKAP